MRVHVRIRARAYIAATAVRISWWQCGQVHRPAQSCSKIYSTPRAYTCVYARVYIYMHVWARYNRWDAAVLLIRRVAYIIDTVNNEHLVWEIIVIIVVIIIIIIIIIIISSSSSSSIIKRISIRSYQNWSSSKESSRDFLGGWLVLYVVDLRGCLFSPSGTNVELQHTSYITPADNQWSLICQWCKDNWQFLYMER